MRVERPGPESGFNTFLLTGKYPVRRKMYKREERKKERESVLPLPQLILLNLFKKIQYPNVPAANFFSLMAS